MRRWSGQVRGKSFSPIVRFPWRLHSPQAHKLLSAEPESAVDRWATTSIFATGLYTLPWTAQSLEECGNISGTLCLVATLSYVYLWASVSVAHTMSARIEHSCLDRSM